MTDGFPRSIADLADWATGNSVTVGEARQRFAQYVTLCSIASVPALRETLVFKGGNALDFVWQPNRSTIDLDFSVDLTGAGFQVNIDTIRSLLDRGLNRVSTRFGVVFAVYRVRQQPPGEGKTFITYEARIGYALSDEQQLQIRMANRQPSPHIIRIEMSINEPICGATIFAVDPNYPQLRVSTLEDIVGEKLRALLQQPIRNRGRRQDLLDIAVIVQGHPELNRQQVADFLRIKAAARDVPVSRAAFQHLEIAERARVGYEELAATTRKVFIPFDEALATILAFVNELPIPE